LIRDLQHESGAYPAAPTFSAYAGYAWLRDGSFTAEGMSRVGAAESADRFHDWACAVLVDRRDRVERVASAGRDGGAPDPSDLLPTRFTLDGRDGTDPWWDFQTDGFGTWLWAVTTHADRHHRDLRRWLPGIELCCDYLAAVGEMACYDWWEEYPEHRHTASLGAVYAGLSAAAMQAALPPSRRSHAATQAGRIRNSILTEGIGAHGGLVKWLGSDAVDGSLPACVVPFGVLRPESSEATGTLDRVVADLQAAGGVHRYLADVFYGGGQWPLLSCLLGWNLVAAGQSQAALRLLRWTADQADRDGMLPEQVPDHLLHPQRRQEWIDRWGPVARPLLWSHGMYLILASELGVLEDHQ
jgi:GH15 family glucan-1,4-alpha-glucosidase